MGMRFLVILSIFISCGQAPGFISQRQEAEALSIEPAQAEDYAYEFSTTKCSTGFHSFDTFAKACNALRDDNLNDHCAEDQREELFLSELCPGEF